MSDAYKTSGTSPPVYHFTNSAALPRILASGELRAMEITPEFMAYERSLVQFGTRDIRPRVALIDATANPNDINAPIRADDGAAFRNGNIAHVRFTLRADDFGPWKEVAAANDHCPKWIEALEKTADGSDPRQWYSRAEPLPLSRVVAIHTQDIFNGDDWQPLDKDAIDYFSLEGKPEVMGVDIGKVCFWSKYKLVHGTTAWEPVRVTGPWSVPAGEGGGIIGPDIDTGRSAYASLMAQPDVRDEKPAPKLAILANPNDDDVIEQITAKPKAALPKTANAKRNTTGVRYVITEDTFRRHPADDIIAEKAELIAEDMWRLPNGGEPYTIRMEAFDLVKCMHAASLMSDETLAQWTASRTSRKHRLECWIDFDIKGDDLFCTSRVFYFQVSGNPDKKWMIENPAADTVEAYAEICEEIGADPTSRQAWWERGNWFFSRVNIIDPSDMAFAASFLRDLLTVATMDTSVVLERTPRIKFTPKQERSSPFRRGGSLYSPEQDVQEVTLRCPGYYRGNGDERGEPTGHKVKMHRRRGHVRTLHRNLPNEFKIYIQPVWINYIPGGPTPPPVNYTLA